tara:strand:+ start:172 stop:429 length:258 start_codon:yes stop_codon:yes gene_type:complete
MKYKIYAIEGCNFCNMARGLLEEKGVPYEYIILEAGSKLILELKDWTKQQTVPLVFEVDQNEQEKFIGGYTELHKELIVFKGKKQ